MKQLYDWSRGKQLILFNMLRTNGHHKLKEHVTLGNQGEYKCDMLNVLREISAFKTCPIYKDCMPGFSFTSFVCSFVKNLILKSLLLKTCLRYHAQI